MLIYQRERNSLRSRSLVDHKRAVRVGDHIVISGTIARNPNGVIIGQDDAKAQTRFILDQIESEIRILGGELRDVTRLRVSVRNIKYWEPVARVFSERFPSIRPDNSLAVTRFSLSQVLVEIAADATVGSGGEAEKFIL